MTQHTCTIHVPHMGHTCTIHAPYMQHTCNIQAVYTQHTRNTHATCMQHTSNMYATYMHTYNTPCNCMRRTEQAYMQHDTANANSPVGSPQGAPVVGRPLLLPCEALRQCDPPSLHEPQPSPYIVFGVKAEPNGIMLGITKSCTGFVRLLHADALWPRSVLMDDSTYGRRADG